MQARLQIQHHQGAVGAVEEASPVCAEGGGALAVPRKGHAAHFLQRGVQKYQGLGLFVIEGDALLADLDMGICRGNGAVQPGFGGDVQILAGEFGQGGGIAAGEEDHVIAHGSNAGGILTAQGIHPNGTAGGGFQVAGGIVETRRFRGGFGGSFCGDRSLRRQGAGAGACAQQQRQQHGIKQSFHPYCLRARV